MYKSQFHYIFNVNSENQGSPIIFFPKMALNFFDQLDIRCKVENYWSRGKLFLQMSTLFRQLNPCYLLQPSSDAVITTSD
jgi:hypothetical protein